MVSREAFLSVFRGTDHSDDELTAMWQAWAHEGHAPAFEMDFYRFHALLSHAGRTEEDIEVFHRAFEVGFYDPWSAIREEAPVADYDEAVARAWGFDEDDGGASGEDGAPEAVEAEEASSVETAEEDTSEPEEADPEDEDAAAAAAEDEAESDTEAEVEDEAPAQQDAGDEAATSETQKSHDAQDEPDEAEDEDASDSADEAATEDSAEDAAPARSTVHADHWEASPLAGQRARAADEAEVVSVTREAMKPSETTGDTDETARWIEDDEEEDFPEERTVGASWTVDDAKAAAAAKAAEAAKEAPAEAAKEAPAEVDSDNDADDTEAEAADVTDDADAHAADGADDTEAAAAPDAAVPSLGEEHEPTPELEAAIEAVADTAASAKETASPVADEGDVSPDRLKWLLMLAAPLGTLIFLIWNSTFGLARATDDGPRENTIDWTKLLTGEEINSVASPSFAAGDIVGWFLYAACIAAIVWLWWRAER